MRLLNVATKQLKWFTSHRDRPPYAVLSHTWKTLEEEVSLQDLQGWLEAQTDPEKPCRPPEGSAKEVGWAKIEGTCTQAKSMGLNWIWVDTCCIDKSSSAELQEAINSMYRWYRASQVCLVYLEDITRREFERSHPDSTATLRQVRWFTRGWTLQELLAPLYVVFFDRSWERIDTKVALARKLEDVCGIDAHILSNEITLRSASVASRMSWASKRETTREEDMAYCLLGLFDIHMPMLYGEGARAFERLQEEIMKQTEDTSLLSWGYSGTFYPEKVPDRYADQAVILASSPLLFQNCQQVTQGRLKGFARPTFSTNARGMFLKAPIRQCANDNALVYVILSCAPRGPSHSNSLLAVPLVSTAASSWSPRDELEQEDFEEFVRMDWCRPVLVSTNFARGAKTRQILITRRAYKKLHALSYPKRSLEFPHAGVKVQFLGGRLQLLGVYPPQPAGCERVILTALTHGAIDPSGPPLTEKERQLCSRLPGQACYFCKGLRLFHFKQRELRREFLLAVHLFSAATEERFAQLTVSMLANLKADLILYNLREGTSQVFFTDLLENLAMFGELEEIVRCLDSSSGSSDLDEPQVWENEVCEITVQMGEFFRTVNIR